MTTTAKKRIWGWFMFDWATQPYNSLLLTFLFGPYFAEIISARYIASGMDMGLAKANAQAMWGWGLTISGLAIALCAPILGALADSYGRKLPYMWVFSIFYILGAIATWFAVPETFNLVLVMGLFIVGLIGMEFATIFTNAMLPELGTKNEIGRISGSGWAMGYWGGLAALVFALLFLAENNEGKTLIGISPLGGLDAEMREGTRFVGIFSAIWFVVFMVPFFMWVHDPKDRPARTKGVVKEALRNLKSTIRKLPRTPSLACYLGSSMLYRDALNGMYTFGGIYAGGVLGWSVVDIGVFGILAMVFGAIAAFLGGRADSYFGPKPVILVSIVALIIAAVSIVSITPTSLFGIPVLDEAMLAGRTASDIAFYLAGCLVGAAGGTIQTASRTMMVRQANPAHMTEAFGLYALAGKATSFLAPFLIGVVTLLSGSQRIGVTPLIALFLLGLVLLIWVKPDGEDDAVWASDT